MMPKEALRKRIAMEVDSVDKNPEERHGLGNNRLGVFVNTQWH